jgi:Sec-independent protein translocase protein TatA
MAKKRPVRPRRSKQAKPEHAAVKRLDELAKDLGEARAEAKALAETVRDQLADEASIHAVERSTTKSKKN